MFVKKKINYVLIISAIAVAIYYYIIHGCNNTSELLSYIGLIPLLCLIKIIRKIFKLEISDNLENIYIIFVILSFLLGSLMKFYHKIYWFDSFTHFVSGILTAMVVFIYLKKTKNYDNKTIFYNILFIIAFVMMIASLWEIIEFSIDKIFGLDTQRVIANGVDDTMKDMICALLGSVVFFFLNKFMWVQKLIEKYEV